MNKQSSNSAFVLIVRLFWAVSVLALYLDAIASVGLHMSVGLSVGVPFDDGISY